MQEHCHVVPLAVS